MTASMRMWGALWVALAMACGGSSKAPATVENKPAEPVAKADDCETFVTKARPFITEQMQARGGGFSDADAADMTGECRKDPKAKSDPMFTCVVGAADDAAVRACFAKGLSEHQRASKRTEASIMLEKLEKNAKVYYVANGRFPKGTAAPVPAVPCCKQPNLKCAAIKVGTSPVWDELDFDTEPSLFQYSYEGDGTKAVVKAVADLDCDGTSIEYRLDLAVVDGNVVANVTVPQRGTD